MNPQEAQAIIMDALIGTDIPYGHELACELIQCGETLGRRFKTPMGIRCESCMGKVLTSAYENGGRLWKCRCNTNAAPCHVFAPTFKIVSYTKYRHHADGSMTAAGKKDYLARPQCVNSPCFHLEECHHDLIRLGVPLADWFAGLARVAA